MRQFLSITKALSDENRARALMALRGGELCLCQLIELLELAPSTVSKHMNLLARASLVECRKDGRWHYYSLAGRNASPETRSAVKWALASLQSRPIIAEDEKKLRRLLRKDRSQIAECYKS